MNNKSILLIISCCLLFLSSCATVPTKGVNGKYHRMQRGETLWRVSKMYKVSLDELVRINRIKDVRNIETGQLIFIPGAEDVSVEIIDLSFEENEDFSWPLKGKVISYFGKNKRNKQESNKGINIQVSRNSKVLSSRGGIVTFYSEDLPGFGATLIIDHQDGFLTVYSNLSSVFVETGDNVIKGDQIAKVDCSQDKSSNYLHFEIRKGHLPQNPHYYLP